MINYVPYTVLLKEENKTLKRFVIKSLAELGPARNAL